MVSVTDNGIMTWNSQTFKVSLAGPLDQVVGRGFDEVQALTKVYIRQKSPLWSELGRDPLSPVHQQSGVQLGFGDGYTLVLSFDARGQADVTRYRLEDYGTNTFGQTINGHTILLLRGGVATLWRSKGGGIDGIVDIQSGFGFKERQLPFLCPLTGVMGYVADGLLVVWKMP